MTDRLDLAHAIEAAGIERNAAENIAGMIFDAIRENVATKADLAELQAALRADIAVTRADLKADIAATRADLKADVAAVNARIDLVERRIDLVEHRLMFRLGSLIVVVVGLLFAALHYWPPHG